MTTTILAGWAVHLRGPFGIPLGADHTCVRVEDVRGPTGKYWPCWGTWEKDWGNRICKGNGDYKAAEAISLIPSPFPLPGLRGVAGIAYGITGTCHQTANRILLPARVTVSKARGYWLSKLAYGTYGNDLRVFLELFPEYKPQFPETNPEKLHEMDTTVKFTSGEYLEDAYNQKVIALYCEQKQAPEKFNPTVITKETVSVLGEEFKLMTEFRLGSVDSQTIKPALKQQADFLKEIGEMNPELHNADLNMEKYAKKVNERFTELLISLPDILGKEEYEKIFDLPALKEIKQDYILIDPNIAAEAQKISKENRYSF